MKFTKARQHRIFQDIVAQIEETILSGALRPGDKLPPERELCAMFATSRATLREALRVIEARGLIRIKLGAGGGAVVREINTDMIVANLDVLVRAGQATPSQLRAVAASLMAQLAADAADKADREEIDRLRFLVADLDKQLQAGALQNEEQLAQTFLTHLGQAVRNPLFALLIRACLHTLGRLPGQRLSTPEALADHLQQIKRLVFTMAQKKRPQAALLGRELIDDLIRL